MHLSACRALDIVADIDHNLAGRDAARLARQKKDYASKLPNFKVENA